LCRASLRLEEAELAACELAILPEGCEKRFRSAFLSKHSGHKRELDEGIEERTILIRPIHGLSLLQSLDLGVGRCGLTIQ